MTTSAWTVTAVDVPGGTNPAVISGAVVQPITIELNQPVTGTVTLRRVDPQIGEFLDPTREIQIRRDGTIMLWGPVVRPEIDQDRATFQIADPAWYLGRRHFGRADRINLLTNGSFESGVTDWDASTLTVPPVVDPFRSVDGGQSVKLVGAATGHDTYLEQIITHAQAHPDGDLVTIAAWVFVPSDSYLGDASGSLGLLALKYDPTDTTLLAVAGDAADDQPTLINAALPKDQWVRLETSLLNVTDGQKIHVRLYPPHGAAWWDLATVTLMESLSFLEQDLATIVHGVVLYAQDQAPYDFGHGKSDVDLDVDVDPTGLTLSKTWQFADHQNIGDELAQLARSRFDWTITYPAGTARALTVGYPHVGATLATPTLEWGVNISKFRLARDRTQQATSAVMLGPGDGPDREEGAAVLPAPAGPTLEDVTVAPDGTLPDELDALAAERLAVLTNPEILEVVCVGILGVVTIGDWVPVLIPPLVDDTYRVVRMIINPANDSATLTLNLREPQTPEEAMARFPRAVDAVRAPGGGVWVVGSDGGVGAFGAADFHGSLPDDAIIPNAPIVAIVPHGADGYWLVGADTGVFAYGDAPARYGYAAMIATEYAAGDRAIVAAELDSTDEFTMIADDGATYAAGSTP